jgi:hypothetical protein
LIDVVHKDQKLMLKNYMTQDDIIRMMKKAGFYIGKDDEFEPAWERFAALALEAGAAHEREACAKVCDDLIGTRAYAVQCAAAIRARGEK